MWMCPTGVKFLLGVQRKDADLVENQIGSQNNKKYPPVIADCPDYWLDMSDGDTSKCVNVKKLGDGSCSDTMNFSQSIWQGSKGLCNKYKWAKKCILFIYIFLSTVISRQKKIETPAQY